MNIFILILSVIVFCFGYVILFGAPYLPTKKQQIISAIDLLNLKKGQTLIELGCGDGRVLKYAAKKGLIVIGYELNPLLVLVAKINNYKYKDKVTVIWGNFWNIKLPKTDGIYCFLLDKYMDKLNNKVLNEVQNPIKLASYAFEITGKKPLKISNGVFLYTYK